MKDPMSTTDQSDTTQSASDSLRAEAENNIPQTDSQDNTNQNNIDINDIYEVANLARLGINEDTAQHYAEDINKILRMMQIISDVDTEGLMPLSNIHEVAHTLRADVPKTDIDREKNQSVAPAVEKGLYLVPQVID